MRRSRIELDVITLALLMWVCVMFTVSATLHFYLPFHSWDALTHWAPEAAFLIEQIQADANTPLEIGFQKHPIYHYLILVWSELTGAKYHSAVIGLPWLLCGVSLAAIVAAYTYTATTSRAFSLIFATLCVSIPLAENHISLSGYAEIFMAVLLCGGVALLARGLTLHSYLHIVAGAVPVVAVTFLKNIGFLYSFLCLLAFFISTFANSPTRFFFI